MKLLWTPEAIKCLSELEEYISRDNAVKAINFVTELLDKPNLLLKNPKVGRIVPELSNELIRELIYKNYRIVYRIKPEQIEILTVFEGHMLFKEDKF